MATTPLFIASVAALRSKIRLTGVPAGTDAEEIINEAVLTVRSGFYRHLGTTRVAQIQALPFTENPTTDDQVVRATANVTETLWVKYELMCALPTAFLDGGAALDQAYHDEALYRENTCSEIEQKRARLWDQILENLDLLAGEESVGEETMLRSAMIEPSSTPPCPGDSIRPFWRRSNWTKS